MAKNLVQETLVLLKPDTVKRGLVGEIITRFERAGLKIKALKMIKFTRELAERFYIDSEEWLLSVGKKAIEGMKKDGIDPKEKFGTDDPKEIGKKIRETLIEFITSGPVVAMVLEGVECVEVVRKMVGATDPSKAAPGTIRGDYTHMSITYANDKVIAVRNVVHASDSLENAKREIKIVFKEDEIYDYVRNIEDVIY